MASKLRTFVFVNNGHILSPPLTTIREYATWMEKYFDEYTCHLELYLNSKKNGGTVSEWHPGTKIGRFFDMQGIKKPELCSWYLTSNSKGMDQLVKHGFAATNDANGKLLRLYTVNQIETYIKAVIDDSFSIAPNCIDPIQVTLTNEDAQALVKPRVKPKRKLF